MKRILGTILIGILVFGCANPKTKAPKDLVKSGDKTEYSELTLQVIGMTCDQCEMTIEKNITKLKGIDKVLANHEDSTTMIVYDADNINLDDLLKAIQKTGYEVTGTLPSSKK